MSLLIKALEKAARERQEQNAREGAGTAADDLALEPMPSAADDDPHGAAATSNDGQRQAAAFVAASAPARGLFVVDYLRERPMLAFYIVAALFAIGYGTYVYLEISYPAMFIARAAPAARPAPPTTARHTAAAAAPHVRPADLQTASRTPGTPAMPASGATGDVRVATTANATDAIAPVTAAAGKAAAPQHAAGHSAPHRDMDTLTPSAMDTAQQATPEKPRRAFAEARQRLQRAVKALTTDKAPPSADRNPIKVTPGGATPTVSPVLTRAYGAYASGDYRQALDLYRRVTHAEPLNTDALLGLAAAAAQTGNEKEAAHSYGRVLNIDPQNALAQAGLINLMGHSDPDAAEARLKLLLARKPSAFIYFALGNVYAGERRWADAQEAYFHAYHRQPDNADYAYNVAVGLEHLGRSQRALHFYRRAVELAGQGGHVHFNVAAAQTQISRLAANAE
ncbi:MAG TPA: tetratricopeptide repeat protein [Burkholderiales bacterium]|nr:tetratricopeptide repeat protein [Burkholderiales bacterium]